MKNKKKKEITKFESLKSDKPFFIEDLTRIQQTTMQEDLTQTQKDLQSMFGHGGGTFWNLHDSTTQTTIYHDLNPRLRGDVRTAKTFGFGGMSPKNFMLGTERSGLF